MIVHPWTSQKHPDAREQETFFGEKMYSTICGLVSGALNKRLLTVLVTLVIVAAGIFAWTRLSIEAYPELSDPQVRLITLYAGKGAEEVEKLVTVPLEKALYGIPGQTSIRSLSVYG
ncbi:MAG TPA: efflux RND transporter permease subunit, partial [Candidatus Melainabacteria bacterium]|nr:efflux RND transporter permease subunit [Candidatus Melainabacteria bacterium]